MSDSREYLRLERDAVPAMKAAARAPGSRSIRLHTGVTAKARSPQSPATTVQENTP
jgi:hypothetical protein